MVKHDCLPPYGVKRESTTVNIDRLAHSKGLKISYWYCLTGFLSKWQDSFVNDGSNQNSTCKLRHPTPTSLHFNLHFLSTSASQVRHESAPSALGDLCNSLSKVIWSIIVLGMVWTWKKPSPPSPPGGGSCQDMSHTPLVMA